MKKSQEIINYLVFGVLTTAVNIVSFWLFDKGLGIDYKLATTLSWIISVVFAFITNKRYVFQSKSKQIGSALREFGSFIFFRLLSLLLDLAVMIILVEFLQADSLAAKIIANVFVVVFNYYASKFFIFKPSTKNNFHKD